MGAVGPLREDDTIVVINELEHRDDEERALAELLRLLRPGGRLCIVVPAFEGLHSEFDRRLGYRRRYRRSGLAAVLDRAGYRVLDARYVDSLGAVGWWLLVRGLGANPTQWGLVHWDRAVVPISRRWEQRRVSRFGQSLLCIAERPRGDAA